MRERARIPAALLALASLASCRPEPAALPGCRADDQCAPDEVCMTGVCLPLRTMPDAWGVELAPLSSAEAGLTELVPKAAPLPLLDLVAPTKIDFVGTLSFDGRQAPPLVAAHVVLTVPPAIGGRPDLVFEADVTMTSAAPAPHFRLPLPAGVLGRAGTLRVFPTGSQVSTHAPTTVSLTVAATADVAISGRTVAIRGRVFTAIGAAPTPLVARAFQGGELASNTDLTAEDGTFTVVVPMGLLGTAPAQAITVELSPPAGDRGRPRLMTKPLAVTGNLDLGDLRLPDFIQPNVFRFPIQGDAEGGPAVPGALVRARTQLADDASSVTDFVRDAFSDVAGNAVLALLPGSTAALRSYELAVLPPPDSPYAIKCVAKQLLSSGGSATMPTSPAAIVLSRRTVRTGVVLRADGTPAAGVVVVATRTAFHPSTPCAAAVSAQPTIVTTDASGSFQLYLDPGTYRIDYDPPLGTPAPRLIEPSFEVGASTEATVIMRSKTLPAGVVVEGTARDAAGQPLSLAAVRLLEPTCGTTPETCTGPARLAPTLQAQARTDAEGHFRAVIAAPPPASPSP